MEKIRICPDSPPGISLQIMAEFRMLGPDRTLLRMKKGSITILNSRNEPAVVLDSELLNLPNKAGQDNAYTRTLQSLEKQPVILLKDFDDTFTAVRAEQKVKDQ